MRKLVDIYGWYGVTAIVVAYALVSFSVVKPTGLEYQILNGTGALGIVLISLFKKAYQPAILNLIWTVIAVVAIVKILS
jgi:multidrug transporter EmrE-like cation transporter